jgi:hypothetical protein
MSTIELGLDTFGDVTVDADGRSLAARPPASHPLRFMPLDLKGSGWATPGIVDVRSRSWQVSADITELQRAQASQL